jgi:hypothetical protein
VINACSAGPAPDYRSLVDNHNPGSASGSVDRGVASGNATAQNKHVSADEVLFAVVGRIRPWGSLIEMIHSIPPSGKQCHYIFGVGVRQELTIYD